MQYCFDVTEVPKEKIDDNIKVQVAIKATIKATDVSSIYQGPSTKQATAPQTVSQETRKVLQKAKSPETPSGPPALLDLSTEDGEIE